MSTKWKKSVDFSLKRVQSSKKKWQQFSADSLIVVHGYLGSPQVEENGELEVPESD